MPYCPRCGVDNPASARFCDQCGATLIPVAPQPATMPAPMPAPIPARPQSAPTPPRPSAALLSAGPINCAQCGASAIPGEAFCNNCGAPLQSPAPQVAATPAPPTPSLAPQPSFPPPQASFPTTQPPPPVPASTPPVAPPVYTPPVIQPAIPARTSLAPARLLLDSGVELGLPTTAHAVIGRADPVSNFAPEVDLGGHGAIDSGVGRRHARLFLQDGQVMLEDLNSTNGTTLNGQRLKPGQPQVIRDGDTMVLGSLRMRFSH